MCVSLLTYVYKMFGIQCQMLISSITCVFEMVNVILTVFIIHHDHIYQYVCVYIFILEAMMYIYDAFS